MNATKKLFLILILLVFTGISNAQSTAIEGVWKLTEIHDGDQTYPMNLSVNFKDAGKIEISGSNVGSWSLDKTENTLTISSDYLMALEGENKIETLSNTELKLVNTKGDINSLTRMSLPKGAELNNKATGEWLLNKIEKQGAINFIGQLVDFNKNGIFYVQEMVFGTWDYNKSNQVLNIDAERITGDHTILKNDNTELILEKEGEKLYFKKTNKQKIQSENKKSGLFGSWEFEEETNADLKRFITFKAPDNFTVLEKGEGMESKSGGMWIFDEKDKTLLLIGQVENLRGLSKVIVVTKKEFSVENNGKIYILKKVVQDAVNIQRLSFSEEDFYDDNGDYKYYDDEQKLPWQDSYQMIADLSKVKHLVYKFSTLIESTKSFTTKILTADVIVNKEKQTLSIDNIFSGYDKYNLPDDTQLSPNEFDYYNKLYPLEGDSYRIVGKEEVITPVGTFICTVIEATASFDEKIKLWMINDKPGIIAKIIKDRAGDLGFYKVYELQEIN